MAEGKTQETWADYVTRIMAKHGSSLRSQRVRTGISRTTVSEWQAGTRPGIEGAVKFIRGFGEDEAEGLAAAGYWLGMPMSKEATEPTGSDILVEGIKALQAEFGKPVPVWFHENTKADLSPDEARAILADLRIQAEEDARLSMAT